MFAKIALLLVTAAAPESDDLGAVSSPPEVQLDDERDTSSDRIRETWLLSLEGVTRIPLDIGVQVGVEAPVGLRLFASYGWVPPAYIGTLTGIAANATREPEVQQWLREVEYSGQTVRVTLGVRPFPKLGFYVDAGYAHAWLNATRDLPPLAIPGVVVKGGGYHATTGLDLWVAELGYQLQLEQRLVLAAGLGIVGTFDSATTIKPVGGAPDDPSIRTEAARRVDRAFESYGYVPTLTLRVGFDFI